MLLSLGQVLHPTLSMSLYIKCGINNTFPLLFVFTCDLEYTEYMCQSEKWTEFSETLEVTVMCRS